MNLQLALDHLPLDEALALAIRVADYVDWFEIGTPLIKQYGIESVRQLRACLPYRTLVADMKTVDAGQWEAQLAFDAGADVITVLGWADDATVLAALAEANHRGKRVCADLLGVGDLITRARKLAVLGVHLLGVHAGCDQQARGDNPLAGLQIVQATVDTPLAVAGGINPTNVHQYLACRPQVIIVGSGVTRAPDPVRAARQLRRALDQEVTSELH